MKRLYLLAFAVPMMAQTTLPGGALPAPFVLQQTFTTGMMGFTTGQTARLNVFNMNPVPSYSTILTTTTPPANCTVELQFFDNKGAVVGQTTVANFAPGATTSLDLPRANVTSETAARAEVRGAVVVNPGATGLASAATVGLCSVFTTLEIFDGTGNTVAFTSDIRLIPALYTVIVADPLK